jgi:hypothetical protein
MIPASSVPFFSTECGDRFADLSQLEQALDRFLINMSSYKPRKYVLDNLSWQQSASIYSRAYFSLMTGEHQGEKSCIGCVPS